jgi:hypothetical protein
MPQDATALLLDAVEQASATAVAANAAKAARAADPAAEDAAQDKAVLQQQAQAVQCLLQLHPSAATAAGVHHRLLHTPAMPEAIARVLIASGMRVRFAQLVAAANSMVEGVEVWGQLMSNVHALDPEQCDMPMATFAICFPSNWVSLCRARWCDCLSYMSQLAHRLHVPFAGRVGQPAALPCSVHEALVLHTLLRTMRVLGSPRALHTHCSAADKYMCCVIGLCQLLLTVICHISLVFLAGRRC